MKVFNDLLEGSWGEENRLAGIKGIGRPSRHGGSGCLYKCEDLSSYIHAWHRETGGCNPSTVG